MLPSDTHQEVRNHYDAQFRLVSFIIVSLFVSRKGNVMHIDIKIDTYSVSHCLLGNEIYGPENVALNTNISLPDIILLEGTKYFTTVYAWNPLGMVVFAISNGVVVDFNRPIKGTVYTDSNYMDREFYSSLVKASWNGFIDRHSYIKEYMYAICPVGECLFLHQLGYRIISRMISLIIPMGISIIFTSKPLTPQAINLKWQYLIPLQ